MSMTAVNFMITIKLTNAPKKNGKECGSVIKVGLWNACSNLKRHLERFHAEKSNRIKQADEQDLKSKQKKFVCLLVLFILLTRGTTS